MTTARTFLLEALDAFASTPMIESAADALDAIMHTLSESLVDRLPTLPNDVRERRRSPADAAAVLRSCI